MKESEELNPETYAICRSDMMLKGQDASHIVHGNSFSEDGFAGQTFDYLLANPPFEAEGKTVEKAVRDEHESKGFAGRFGPCLWMRYRWARRSGGENSHSPEIDERSH